MQREVAQQHRAAGAEIPVAVRVPGFTWIARSDQAPHRRGPGVEVQPEQQLERRRARCLLDGPFDSHDRPECSGILDERPIERHHERLAGLVDRLEPGARLVERRCAVGNHLLERKRRSWRERAAETSSVDVNAFSLLTYLEPLHGRARPVPEAMVSSGRTRIVIQLRVDEQPSDRFVRPAIEHARLARDMMVECVPQAEVVRVHGCAPGQGNPDRHRLLVTTDRGPRPRQKDVDASFQTQGIDRTI